MEICCLLWFQSDIVIAEACDRAFLSLKGGFQKRKPVYWWFKDITSTKRLCIKARRVVTRGRKRNGEETLSNIDMEYRQMKKMLRDKIRRGKLRMWKELCMDLNICSRI